MKNSYYENLYKDGIKRLKQLKNSKIQDNCLKIKPRLFSKREKILGQWIIRMLELNKKYNKLNK